MKFKKPVLQLLFITLMGATTRSYAQKSEIETLFHDLEKMDAGTQGPFNKADPVLERLTKSSKENVSEALPVILQETSDPHLSVRRVAAMALWEISTRSDGQILLAGATPVFTTLLVDPDLPIRRISMLAVATLHPIASSPISPFLKTYLAREDAVSTIGAFVATVLMEAAPDDADSTKAIVQFMHRSDQTAESQEALLNAIRYRAKSHNRDIAREVARYADSPEEQISVLAIETLQGMGSSAVADNQQTLSRIEADPRKAQSVRIAATKALSSNH